MPLSDVVLKPVSFLDAFVLLSPLGQERVSVLVRDLLKTEQQQPRRNAEQCQASLRGIPRAVPAKVRAIRVHPHLRLVSK